MSKASSNLGKSVERAKNIIDSNPAARGFMSERSPIAIRPVDQKKVEKEREMVFKIKNKISNYFASNKGSVDGLSETEIERRNLSISALCFLHGYEALKSDDVEERVAEIKKSGENYRLLGGKNFQDIHGAFAHLKLCDEVFKPDPSGNPSSFEVSLSNKNRDTFTLQHKIYPECKSILLKDFGTYAAFAKMTDKWNAGEVKSQNLISEVSADIGKSYVDSDHSSKFTGDAIKAGLIKLEQVSILKKAIFTLLVIESQRNPASVVINAMALDLIADGKSWSDLIIVEESVKAGAAVQKAKSAPIQRDKIQIPMTSVGATGISEVLNLSFKNLLVEGEYSNYGGISDSKSDAKKEAELRDFINAQGRFVQYWADCKHEFLENNPQENLESLKRSLDSVKRVNDPQIKASYGDIFDAHQNLIEEFSNYFYRGASAAVTSEVPSAVLTAEFLESGPAKKQKLNHEEDCKSEATTSPSETTASGSMEGVTVPNSSVSNPSIKADVNQSRTPS